MYLILFFHASWATKAIKSRFVSVCLSVREQPLHGLQSVFELLFLRTDADCQVS